jgi:hypothetical protein
LIERVLISCPSQRRIAYIRQHFLAGSLWIRLAPLGFLSLGLAPLGFPPLDLEPVGLDPFRTSALPLDPLRLLGCGAPLCLQPLRLLGRCLLGCATVRGGTFGCDPFGFAALGVEPGLR